MIMGIKTTHVTSYPKHGYKVHTEEHTTETTMNKPLIVKSAYTKRGDYIGNAATAHHLCAELGIAPELATPKATVCSVGFCAKDQMWYGWSHRAMFGFGIGSTIKAGDAGYKPDNVREIIDAYDSWWTGEINIIDGRTIELIPTAPTMVVELPDDPDDGITLTEITAATPEKPFRISTGRGEWTAKTLDDARQMAIDYADDVA